MEIQPPPIKMPSSPTLSNAMVSPETLSHHSSPAKTSRICYQPHHNIQHQTIDGSVPSSKVPLSISSHHQLAAATMGTPIEYPHSSISGLSGIHSDVIPDSHFRFFFFINFYLNEKKTTTSFLIFHTVRSITSANMSKFGDNTNLTDVRSTSSSIIISFIISSSPSSRASAVACYATTFTITTSYLYTANRDQTVSHFISFHSMNSFCIKTNNKHPN